MIITNPKNLKFTKDSLINYKFIATGGVAPYKFKTPSTLPAGLTLTKKGILKGITPSVTSFNLRLKAISSTGESVFKQFVIVIDAPITTKSDLYVASYSDNLISMYSLDASTGALSFTSEYSTDTLSVRDYKMCISNDKKNVYLTAQSNSVILVLNRDIVTGLLTFNSTISDGSSYLWSIAISKDDKNVYACDSGRGFIRSYDRNRTTGVLTYNSIPSVYAGTNLTDLCISSDGKNVYAIIAMDNKIIVYNRNISTGTLTQISSYVTDQIPWVVVESIDGKSVYVTNYNSNTISIYARDTLTGLLTLRGAASTFNQPNKIVVSPDNKNVYVVCNSVEQLVSVYGRNELDGMLTYKTSSSTGSWPGVSIVFSPDNKNVYVGTYTTIVVFNRDTIGNLSLNSTISRTVNLSDMYIVS